MKKKPLSPSVLFYIVVCFLGNASLVHAGEDVLYNQIWHHSLELAGQIWEQYPQSRTALDWYIGGKIAYYRHDYVDAASYFLTASRIATSKWLKRSAQTWAKVVEQPSLPLEPVQKGSPDFLSELAVMLQERGNSHAWRLARQAITAGGAGTVPARYWHNLAMSCPADKQLWQRALQISMETPATARPLFDPGIFLSLQRFISKFGTAPLRQNYQPLAQKEIVNWAGCDLWRLAWDYGQRGYEYQQAGEAYPACWYGNAALAIYDLAFAKSKRGNLAAFPVVDMVRYSRILLLCRRYDAMLFYLYRPDNCPPFRWLNAHFRPSLQLLAATQVVASRVYQPQLLPSALNPVILIKYRQMFLGRQLARSAGR